MVKEVVYLMIYTVSYVSGLKYKAFKTYEAANYFYKNYQHHLLSYKEAFITDYKILILDLNSIQNAEKH